MTTAAKTLHCTGRAFLSSLPRVRGFLFQCVTIGVGAPWSARTARPKNMIPTTAIFTRYRDIDIVLHPRRSFRSGRPNPIHLLCAEDPQRTTTVYEAAAAKESWLDHGRCSARTEPPPVWTSRLHPMHSHPRPVTFLQHLRDVSMSIQPKDPPLERAVPSKVAVRTAEPFLD